MRRSAHSAVWSWILVVAIALTTSPDDAIGQNPLDAMRKRAEEAKRKADELRRKLDSTRKALNGTAGTSTPTAGTSAASAPPSSTVRAGSPAPATTPPLSTTVSPASVSIDSMVVARGEPGFRYTVSPRGHHVAAIVMKGSRVVVQHDGKEGPLFDALLEMNIAGNTTLQFSENGEHLAYVGRQGNDWVYMVDGVEVARGTPWEAAGPVVVRFGFAGDGRHHWLLTNSGATSSPPWRFFIDGKPGPYLSTAISTAPTFSPDGRRHAYEVELTSPEGRSTALVVDGKLLPAVGLRPEFAADGRLFTVVNRSRTGTPDLHVLADGVPFVRGENVTLRLGPLGAPILAVIGIPGQVGSTLAINGKPLAASECGERYRHAFFSGDGKHWAIHCYSPTAQFVMVDGRRGRNYSNLPSAIRFTDDGRPVYEASNGNRTFVVVGEEEFGPYEALEWLRELPVLPPGAPPASPIEVRGNRVAFLARPLAAGRNRTLVIDGTVTAIDNVSAVRLSPSFARKAVFSVLGPHPTSVDGTALRHPCRLAGAAGTYPSAGFSADDRHFACVSVIMEETRQSITVDGITFPTTAFSLTNLSLSANGEHIAWLAIGAPAPLRSLLYVDGQAVLELGRATSLPLEDGGAEWWSMDDSGTVTFLSPDGDTIKRYRVTPRGSSLDAMLKGAGR